MATLRFAPSPNGPLHLGHAHSALLNETWARRLGGRLLVRIEDVDPGRSRPGMAEAILADLDRLGIAYARPVLFQSTRTAAYAAALGRLRGMGVLYPSFRTRAQTAREAGGWPRDPDGAPRDPGLERGLDPAEAAARVAAGEPHAWRLNLDAALALAPGPATVTVFDEGGTREEPANPAAYGDATLARKDAPAAYHLAHLVDDAHQGVTHVVRGAEFAPAMGLHALLQRLLGLPRPAYSHHAMLTGPDGTKLAKSRDSPGLFALGEDGAAIRARLGFG